LTTIIAKIENSELTSAINIGMRGLRRHFTQMNILQPKRIAFSAYATWARAQVSGPRRGGKGSRCCEGEGRHRGLEETHSAPHCQSGKDCQPLPTREAGQAFPVLRSVQAGKTMQDNPQRNCCHAQAACALFRRAEDRQRIRPGDGCV
jgi:hypothetical protein